MCIIESKPDNIPADLRIATPWPELQSLADSIDLKTCDDITHKHTPWGASSSFKTSCASTRRPSELGIYCTIPQLPFRQLPGGLSVTTTFLMSLKNNVEIDG